jgi:hypothetical protein
MQKDPEFEGHDEEPSSLLGNDGGNSRDISYYIGGASVGDRCCDASSEGTDDDADSSEDDVQVDEDVFQYAPLGDNTDDFGDFQEPIRHINDTADDVTNEAEPTLSKPMFHISSLDTSIIGDESNKGCAVGVKNNSFRSVQPLDQGERCKSFLWISTLSSGDTESYSCPYRIVQFRENRCNKKCNAKD